MEKKQALNGIRGIMAVAIFLSHCGWVKYFEQTKSAYEIIYYMYGAVTFFFVLSGFFFEYAKRKEKFRTYIFRKIEKIFPIHFVTLVCSVILMLLRGQINIKESLGTLTANLFLIHAWVPDEKFYFSYNAVSWYLSALIVCYVLGYFISKYVKRIEWVLVIGYTIEILLCVIFKETHHWLLYINPLFRTVDFCMGVKICRCLSGQKRTLPRNLCTFGEMGSLCLFIVAVIVSRTVDINWTYTMLFLVPVVAIIFIFGIEGGMVSSLFKIKIFQFLGNVSLELFMTHKFIVNNVINFRWFIKIAAQYAYLAWLILFVMCIALAYITHWGIDFIKKCLVGEKAQNE